MSGGGGGVGLAGFAVAVCGFEREGEGVGSDGVCDGGAGAVAVDLVGHMIGEVGSAMWDDGRERKGGFGRE